MKTKFLLVSCAALILFPAMPSAEEMSMQDHLNLWVAACVGSGHKIVIEGEGGAEMALTLKKFDLNGRLEGSLSISREDYHLLIDGISSMLNEHSADQADKVRECLAPLREWFLTRMKKNS